MNYVFGVWEFDMTTGEESLLRVYSTLRSAEDAADDLIAMHRGYTYDVTEIEVID